MSAEVIETLEAEEVDLDRLFQDFLVLTEEEVETESQEDGLNFIDNFYREIAELYQHKKWS